MDRMYSKMVDVSSLKILIISIYGYYYINTVTQIYRAHNDRTTEVIHTKC